MMRRLPARKRLPQPGVERLDPWLPEVPGPRRRHAETGAVLVEALIAILIVAAMAGLWFETVAGNARQQQALADRRLAMLVARSQLATVGVLSAIAPGETTGSDAGFDWKITIEGGGEAPRGARLVTVTVTRPDRGQLASLTSLRLGQ